MNIYNADIIMTVLLPDTNIDPELFPLTTAYQVHYHLKSWRKYKNQTCRCNFGKFFSNKTNIAVPLSSDMPGNERNIFLEKRELILKTVKRYIDV